MATKRAKALTEAVSKEMEERGFIRPTEGPQEAHERPTEGLQKGPILHPVRIRIPGGRLEHAGGPGLPGGHDPERADPKGDQGTHQAPGGGASVTEYTSKRPKVPKVSVHVHYLLARGAVTGNYDFWTLLLHQAFDPGHVIWAFVWALAIHAVELLRNSKTPSKRADIIIPFSNQAKVVTKIILVAVPLPSGESVKVPSKRKMYGTIVAAIKEFQAESERDPRRALSVIVELKIKTARADTLQIRVYESSERLEALEGLISDAKAVKPITLRVEVPPKKHRKAGGSVSKARRSSKRQR